ncbi:MAG: atsK, partial [Caulobacteraceae bacterium]|nr:atsK [Caulobacteraceae bacterium]
MNAITKTVQAPVLPFDVTPVAGRIGAEIHGVHLSGDLDPLVAAGIWSTLDRYKVVFFRGQDHLDEAGQEAAAFALGTPVRHPTVDPKAGGAYLGELDSIYGAHTNSWHTDVTFVDAYPVASMLRA